MRHIEDEAQYKNKSSVAKKSPQPTVPEEAAPRPTHHVRQHCLNLKGVLHPKPNDYTWSGSHGTCACGGIGYHPVVTSCSELQIQDTIKDILPIRPKSTPTQAKSVITQAKSTPTQAKSAPTQAKSATTQAKGTAVTSGDLPDCRYSVMGNFNQGTVEGIFGPAENAGTQCTSMAYTAVVSSAFTPVGIWSSDTLDSILQVGYQFHEQILTNVVNNEQESSI